MSPQPLLKLKGLVKHYPVYGGIWRRPVNAVKALDGIDLNIYRGECLGLVGESGCGKTTTGKAIIRLSTPSAGRIDYYDAHGNGTDAIDIAQLSRRGMRRAGVRGKLQMVFQDPTTSLDPRMLIKHIIAEPLKALGGLSRRQIDDRVIELLALVGLTQDHYLRYPHEFSGGQRQRIAVARAIATHPEFLVLDEPTSALDVSVQAQILNLLHKLRRELQLTYLFVTHHLLVVKYISDRLAVMYLGKLVEHAPTEQIFAAPRHPYTLALLSGIPVPEIDVQRHRMVLTGDVPSPLNPPSGCRFHTRCPFVIDVCRQHMPELTDLGRGHHVACHRQADIPDLVRARFG